MPSTLLFAINNEGRVFGLSTNGTKWREFIYLGLEFKQLSAVPNFLWAVGGDRQIYVHVHGLDIPIRVKEEAYENERWSPFEGFSKKLLPTDRYSYSNIDGTVDRSLKKIRLPSMAWQWEGDWKLELTLDGQPLDHDGWTYAIDFPGTYYPTKQWTSCVRRRKWVRYRRYIALNSWCAIAPLHKDPTQEPFIGISVGGNKLPGAKEGTMLVWAVTAYGRPMFRTEVGNSSPEGQRWMFVPLPKGCEVSQVSVGVTGLVWVVLCNGKALVRTGITRDCVTGTDWSEVEPPGVDLLLTQVSIGYNGLWAITRDSRVWFRKGILGDSSGVSENYAKGTGWVEMCGNMACISVASNDQVWAVGAEDRILYYRTSVTPEDLMGKTWRALSAPTQLSRTSSTVSLRSGGGESGLREKRHRSWASLNRHSGSHENKPKVGADFNDACHSAPAIPRNVWPKASDGSAKSFSSIASSDSDSLAASLPKSICSISENSNENLEERISEVKEYNSQADNDNDSNINRNYENVSHPVCGFINKEIAVPTRSWSPQHAGGTVVATEAHYAADSIVFESDELAGIYSEHGEREDEDDYLYWTDTEAFWSFVEAGACILNINHLPNWFVELNTNRKAESAYPWRVKILNELKNRFPTNFEKLENYEKAIDNSTWTKAGKCKCLSGATEYRDCTIEIEWVSGENDNLDCGTLTISSSNKSEIWAQINLREVRAVINCSVPRHPRIALNYNSSAPLQLQFNGENEFEEWKSELASICCRLRNFTNTPSSDSMWATTAIGDIYVCDLSQIKAEQQISDNDTFSTEMTFVGFDMPIEIPLQAGFLPGSFLNIFGCVQDKADRFYIDLICREENGTNNVAFHFNPRLNDDVVVQNTRKGASWGSEERNQNQPFKGGTVFEIKIICESDRLTVLVNGSKFSSFTIKQDQINFEISPSFVTHLNCGGDITISKIQYSAKRCIIEPDLLFWRQIDGHLKKVETAGGVTWGIGFDGTPWVYLGSDASVTQKMHDTHYYYVYENQRWNPLTGYTSHGLPTDRFMWSDVTGKHKRVREKTMLLSKKWHWINDWSIDFHTPGGVDKEGWQYAVDFPSSYHGTKHFTDYVRRRRWFRCAKLETEGPWMELGYTLLSDCSLCANGTEVVAWGVAANGYVLFRRGVSKAFPSGLSWEHVASDEQMLSISCSPKQVWAVGKSGVAFCRMGISSTNPTGEYWETIEAPQGTSLKQITIGDSGIWALDSCGRLSIRKEVSSVYPVGSHWKTLPQLSADLDSKSDCDFFGISISDSFSGFRHVVSKSNLWALTSSGRLAFRLGVNPENPTGSTWLMGIQANLLHLST